MERRPIIAAREVAVKDETRAESQLLNDDVETYLVSTDDKMIPPGVQRAMSKRSGSTVAEVKGSHAVYVFQRKAVADL